MENKGSDTQRPPVWPLAALPPALFGLALSLHVAIFVPLRSIVWGAATPLNLLPKSGMTRLPLAFFALLILTLAAGAVVGLWRRMAAWSHTWTTSTVVAVALALTILADDVPYLVSSLIDQLLLLGLVLALAVVAFVAARRSLSEAALVAMGFASAFSLTTLFSSVASPMLRMDIALVVAPAGLIFALLIAVYVRWQRGTRWIVLVLTAVLAGALIWTYEATVAAALSADIALTFLRVLGSIAAVGFLAPLALGWVLSLRRRPALRPA